MTKKLSRIGRILKYVMWGISVLVFIAYYVAPEIASYFRGDITSDKIVINSWANFWSPTGLNYFLWTFLPLGLLTWLMGYIETEKGHKAAWHLGTLIKIAGYAALVIVIFSYILIPLSSADIRNADDVRRCFSPYFSTNEGIIKFLGTFIAIAIVIVAGIEIQSHSEEKEKEEPTYD